MKYLINPCYLGILMRTVLKFYTCFKIRLHEVGQSFPISGNFPIKRQPYYLNLHVIFAFKPFSGVYKITNSEKLTVNKTIDTNFVMKY